MEIIPFWQFPEYKGLKISYLLKKNPKTQTTTPLNTRYCHKTWDYVGQKAKYPIACCRITTINSTWHVWSRDYTILPKF